MVWPRLFSQARETGLSFRGLHAMCSPGNPEKRRSKGERQAHLCEAGPPWEEPVLAEATRGPVPWLEPWLPLFWVVVRGAACCLWNSGAAECRKDKRPQRSSLEGL